MIPEIYISAFIVDCTGLHCSAFDQSGHADGTIGLIRKRETKNIEQILFFVLFCTRIIAAWSCKNYCNIVFHQSQGMRGSIFGTITAATMNGDKMCPLQLIYGYYRRPSIWASLQGYVHRGLPEIKTPRTWQGGLRCSARAQDTR
jgi:hypothetical protein